MDITIADQTIYFLFSLLLGVIISAIYDIVRITRFLGFTKVWQIIFTDILYFVICAFITVLFSLPFNKGAVRYFVVFGEAVGFIVYRFTVGEYSGSVYCFLIRIFGKIIEKSLKILRFFSNNLLKANRFVVYNVGNIIHKVQNIVFSKKKDKCYEQKRSKKTTP